MEDSEFVQKYGPVKVKFIQPPPHHPLITRPHALNYFHKDHLYRTNGERGSTRFELFFDLLYVGIVANLARTATEEASGLSLLRYILVFTPAWQIWQDLKDFMNYYYNDDLTQRSYVLWIMALLVIYTNNAPYVADSNKGTAMVVLTYIVARLSGAAMIFTYTFFVQEHRLQMRFNSLFIVCTCGVWLSVIWVPVRVKIALAFLCITLETLTYSWTFHPSFKKLLKVEYSTAVNIEHEVERMGAFYTVALGEFLYGIVANAPTEFGFTHNLARAIMTLIIAYCFLWFYFNGEGSEKAVHAIRRSIPTAYLWLYGHIPLFASLLLAADAAGDFTGSDYESTKKLASSEDDHLSESEIEEANHSYSLQFFFTGGLCVALICLTMLAILDKSMDKVRTKKLPKVARVAPRIPVAITILCLAFAEMETTLLMGIVALILVLLLVFETYAMMPITCATMGADRKMTSEEVEAQAVSSDDKESNLVNRTTS